MLLPIIAVSTYRKILIKGQSFSKNYLLSLFNLAPSQPTKKAKMIAPYALGTITPSFTIEMSAIIRNTIHQTKDHLFFFDDTMKVACIPSLDSLYYAETVPFGLQRLKLEALALSKSSKLSIVIRSRPGTQHPAKHRSTMARIDVARTA